MKKGFDRLRSAEQLRGVAVAGVMGLGALGGGSVRAATTTPPRYTTQTQFIKTAITRSVSTGLNSRPIGTWMGVGNNSIKTWMWNSFTTSSGFSYQASLGGDAFGISDAATIQYTGSNYSGATTWNNSAHWHGLMIAVDGQLFTSPSGKITLTTDNDAIHPQVVTAASDKYTTASGVEVGVEYFFHRDRMVVRAVYTLKNTMPDPQNPSVLVLGRFGANNATTIQDSSDGNTTIDPGELWFSVASLPSPNAIPAIAHSLMGQGAPVEPVHVLLPTTGLGPSLDQFGQYAFRYDLSIPALEERRIVVFSAMNSTDAGASATSADFETLGTADAAGLLEFMTPYDISTIVNYDSTDSDSDGIYDTDDNCPDLANADQADSDANGIGDVCDASSDAGGGGGGGGAIGIPGLLTLLGGLVLGHRRRRN